MTDIDVPEILAKAKAYRERAAAERRRYYKRNAASEAKYKAQRSARVRDILNIIKLERGCCDCGYNSHAEALDFDHVDGQKSFTISGSIQCNLRTIRAEVAKCEVRCANCHRIATKRRLNAGMIAVKALNLFFKIQDHHSQDGEQRGIAICSIIAKAHAFM